MQNFLSKLPFGKKRSLESYNNFGYVFLLPFFLAVLVFQLYPILYTIFLSFTDLHGFETTSNMVGFKNYLSIFNNDMFRKAVSNTFILWIINFIPQIGLALLLSAWFTNVKLRLKGTGFFKIIFYLPNIITAASVAVLFYALFSYPLGPMNLLLQNVHIVSKPIAFLRSEWGTRAIVSFIQFWMWYGQTTIVLVAGIMSIDESLFEAAIVDGANDNQVFRLITLPLLKPIVLYTLVTSLIGGLQMFDIPFLLTNGNPNNSTLTMTMYIYKQAFTGARNFNVAATASVLLLLISIVLSTVLFRLFRGSSKKGDK